MIPVSMETKNGPADNLDDALRCLDVHPCINCWGLTKHQAIPKAFRQPYMKLLILLKN